MKADLEDNLVTRTEPFPDWETNKATQIPSNRIPHWIESDINYLDAVETLNKLFR